MRAQKLLTILFIALIGVFANQNASAQLSWWNPVGTIVAGNSGFNPGSQELGTNGTSDTALGAPYGICADGSGNIYIADFGHHRVQRWHVGDPFGTTVVGATGVSGSDNAHLNGPTGVAFDHLGNLFVTDRQNNRVMKYAAASINAIGNTGQTTSSVQGTLFCGGNAYGSALKDVNAPTGIFITAGASDDSVYVSEGNDDTAGVYRVLRFPPNSSGSSSMGTIVAGGTHSHGIAITEVNLDHPTGIYVNATTRDVYIADEGNARVQEWSEPYTTGVTVAGSATGQHGSSNALLSDPFGVWLDAYGNILVSDFSNSRIMEWSPGAAAGVLVIGHTDTANYDSVHLGYPYGICLDANKNLFVTDDEYYVAKEFTGYYTGIKAITSLISKVSLYPNPNMGSFTLQSTVDASLEGKNIYIVVMDMSGKIVMSTQAVVQNHAINKQINVGAEIPNGVYQLQVISGNDKANSKFEVIR